MKYMNKLLFGTAGIPLSTHPHNTLEGVRQVKKLGMGVMELAFVHNINISPKKAPEIRRVAKREKTVLTCHAPYYVNLNAREPEKRKASIERIINSARVLSACGGWSVCFHAGFYMGMQHSSVYDNIKESVSLILDTLKEEGIDLWIRPEIGGKTTSWGSLDEVIHLSQEFDQVLPCIDWAHLHARTLGKNNSHEEFIETLNVLERGLGKECLKEMHCHVEGIEIGKTGERFHKDLKNSGLKYQELMKAFKDYNIKGVVISESPCMEEDALLLQKTYKSA